MGKLALVHTFVAAVHALRCFVHLTRGGILPTGKMFLDLSEPLRVSGRIKVNLKNVHRPIRGSLRSLITRCRPEECSWTYPGFTSALSIL